MKNQKKIAIWAAVGLVVAGLILSFAALCAMDFDFNKMNTLKYATNTYALEEPFSNISIKTAECDLRLLPSEDDSCKVVCEESEEIFHSVTVENNTLTIGRTDARKWYEHIVGIYWGEMTITVYLPQTDYASLYALNVSGNITIPDEFSFLDAELHNTSGKVDFAAAVENDLSIKTVSGNLHIKNAHPKGLTAQSTSGRIVCSDVAVSENIKMKTVSGKINSSNVTVSGRMTVETVSGNIRLSGCDADSLQIKSTSGDVFGTLLTEKSFHANSTSGHIDVPDSTSGGNCEVKTTSGNITFKIQ